MMMIEKLTELVKVEIAKPRVIMGGPGLEEDLRARRIVRAILTALLEPSEAMTDAPYVQGHDNYWGYEANGKPSGAEDCFKAMIQAALDEKEG